MRKTLLGRMALALFSAAVPAVAQDQPSPPPPAAQQQINPDDRKILHDLYTSSRADVRIGQLAQQRGTTPAIKDFGQRLATDQAKLAGQAQQVAQQVGYQLPIGLEDQQQALLDALATYNGADFDRHFVDAMVKERQQAVSELKDESQKGENAAVKGLARNALPTLQAQLRRAEQLQQQVEKGGQ